MEIVRRPDPEGWAEIAGRYCALMGDTIEDLREYNPNFLKPEAKAMVVELDRKVSEKRPDLSWLQKTSNKGCFYERFIGGRGSKWCYTPTSPDDRTDGAVEKEGPPIFSCKDCLLGKHICIFFPEGRTRAQILHMPKVVRAAWNPSVSSLDLHFWIRPGPIPDRSKYVAIADEHYPSYRDGRRNAAGKVFKPTKKK